MNLCDGCSVWLWSKLLLRNWPIYRGSKIQVKRQEGYREEFREDHGVGNRVRRPDEEREKARG